MRSWLLLATLAMGWPGAALVVTLFGDAEATVGFSYQLGVTVSQATGTPTYEVFKDGVLLGPMPTNAVTLNSISALDQGIYVVRANDSVTSALSNPHTFMVRAPPVFILSPDTATAPLTQNATFFARLNSQPEGANVSWAVNGTELTGDGP